MVMATPLARIARTETVPFLHRIDPHGRILRKLRISVTEACNLRCVYCMPAHAVNPPEEGLLAPAEIGRLASLLVERGIQAIRLTGGEPTARRDFAGIVDALSDVRAEKGITTNGLRLERHARSLARAGFVSANVSLDSLDPDNFRRIARGGDLSKVLSGIDAALSEGLRVKVNCVVLRGLNDREIPAFHDLSARLGVEVRFLELMRIGPARSERADLHLPAAEIRARLEDHAGLLSPVRSAPDSTVKRWTTPLGALVATMESETAPFCGNCSRLRLSSRGVLHPCLFRDDGVDLKGAGAEEIEERILSVVHLKPADRIEGIDRPMNRIGG
jgi:cyclic pyranopterin phosphate synthase